MVGRVFGGHRTAGVGRGSTLQKQTNLHWQSFLTIKLYSAVNNHDPVWTQVYKQTVRALYSNDIAKAAGTVTPQGDGEFINMQKKIAYSAVDKDTPNEGKPFGDTASWAFFDDADDLGASLHGDHSPRFSKKRCTSEFSIALDVKQEIANLLVQYAGALAKNKITEGTDGKVSTPLNGSVDVRKGILSLSKDESVLSVDLSNVMWKDALGLQTKLDPIALADFRSTFLGQAPLTEGIVNYKFINWLFGSNKIDDDSLKYLAKLGWSSTTADIFDRFDIATTDEGGEFKIEKRSYEPGPLRGNNAHVDVFIGNANDEKITGTKGDDLIVGHSGTDRIDGGAGDDVIIAGTGSNSVTIGGVGRDIVINFSKGGKVYGDTIDGVDAKGNSTPSRVADSAENADIFWYSPDITIMDAQVHDRLLFQGVALTGGSRNPAYAATALVVPFFVGNFTPGAAISATIADTAQNAGIYFDKLYPAITYKMDNGTLRIGNIWDGLLRFVTGQGGIFSSGGPEDDLKGVMSVRNFNLQHSIWGFEQGTLAEKGTLGMSFKDSNPLNSLLAKTAKLVGITAMPEIIFLQTLLLLDEILAEVLAIRSAAKTARWIAGGDPLIIDLDGNGIETTTLDGSNVYFNLDGGKFTSRTGWLSGNDGFLVLDRNSQRHDRRHQRNVRQPRCGRLCASGAIRRQSGRRHRRQRRHLVAVADLAGLQRRRRKPGRRIEDHGRGGVDLAQPGAHAARRDDAARHATALRRTSDVRRRHDEQHVRGHLRYQQQRHAICRRDRTSGLAAGYPPRRAGLRVDDRSVDRHGERYRLRRTGHVDGRGDDDAEHADSGRAGRRRARAWGELLTADGRADARAGRHRRQRQCRAARPRRLCRGRLRRLLDAALRRAGARRGRQAIARATMQDVLAQATAPARPGSSSRPGRRPRARRRCSTAPRRLIWCSVVDGRAVILDYGIEQADGSWKLASDSVTTYATKADILALAHATGTEWRTETIGFNPLAIVPVERIGVRFTDGIAVDYTVQVTDQDGTFYVWARNLDRALELEERPAMPANSTCATTRSTSRLSTR